MSYVHLDRVSFVADLIRTGISDHIILIQKDLQLVEITNEAWVTAAYPKESMVRSRWKFYQSMSLGSAVLGGEVTKQRVWMNGFPILHKGDGRRGLSSTKYWKFRI